MKLNEGVGLIGVIVVGVMMVVYRLVLATVEGQAEDDAVRQFKAAQQVLSWREEVRLANVGRFAAELSAKPEVLAALRNEPSDQLEAALKTTSFGPGGANAVLVDRAGEKKWAVGAKASGSVVLQQVKSAISGAPQLVMLPPESPSLADLGFSNLTAPMLVAVAPLSAAGEPLGAVIVAEPMGPEFFMHFTQLTGTKLVVQSGERGFGTAPVEALKEVRGTDPYWLKTEQGRFIAQRIDFRVPPSFELGDAIVAVDRDKLQSRHNRIFYVYIGALITVVAALYWHSRKKRS